MGLGEARAAVSTRDIPVEVETMRDQDVTRKATGTPNPTRPLGLASVVLSVVHLSSRAWRRT